MKQRLLIIDDEKDMLILLKRTLEPDLGIEVVTASSGEEGLKLYSEQAYKNPFDLVLADIKMPGMNGMELLELIKRENPGQTIVMMTAFGSIDTAVAAMSRGAYDFITKPFDHDALLVRLEKALERSRLLRENRRLQEECIKSEGLEDLVGKSAVMKKLYETIKTVAKTDLTVLITGESGTGKDLAAAAVHALSMRSCAPFVAVNCPTVPEHILESELFGYKKGAFTHAVQNKTGLFQEAHNGSIFLDEIGDVTPTIQTKLLRVLQQKEIKPLGSTKIVHVDVRIIASTNQDLMKKIKDGSFREDFFYRLNVLPIRMPALREHSEDIPLIAGHLLMKHCAEMNKPLKRLSPELIDIFMNREWTGNVREMENIILQGLIFAEGDEITPSDLGMNGVFSHNPAGLTPDKTLPYKDAKEDILTRFNAVYIGDKLKECEGNVTKAAKTCGLERQSLQQIMKRYNINAEDYRS